MHLYSKELNKPLCILRQVQILNSLEQCIVVMKNINVEYFLNFVYDVWHLTLSDTQQV